VHAPGVPAAVKAPVGEMRPADGGSTDQVATAPGGRTAENCTDWPTARMGESGARTRGAGACEEVLREPPHPAARRRARASQEREWGRRVDTRGLPVAVHSADHAGAPAGMGIRHSGPRWLP